MDNFTQKEFESLIDKCETDFNQLKKTDPYFHFDEAVFFNEVNKNFGRSSQFIDKICQDPESFETIVADTIHKATFKTLLKKTIQDLTSFFNDYEKESNTPHKKINEFIFSFKDSNADYFLRLAKTSLTLKIYKNPNTPDTFFCNFKTGTLTFNKQSISETHQNTFRHCMDIFNKKMESNSLDIHIDFIQSSSHQGER